jgi:hypothetical protein
MLIWGCHQWIVSLYRKESSTKTSFMEQNLISEQASTKGTAIPPDALPDHWQGHRRLTRKMIEAYPEDKFINYSVGGMRPFSGFVMEMIRLAALACGH